MQFPFTPKYPVSLQSLRRNAGRKSVLRVLIYLTLLAINITSFFELKAIHRLLSQVSQPTQYTLPVLKLKEHQWQLNS